MPGFRVNAKNYFLTYPQCDLSSADLRDFLLTKEGDRINWMCIARELHQDGNPHFHIQIEFVSAKSIKSADYYDFRGFHPNISGTRNVKKVADYVSKGADYELYGITQEEWEEICEGRGQKKTSAYTEVLACDSYEAACEAVRRVDPRAWVNNGDRIRENLRHTFVPKFPEYLNFIFYFNNNV